MEDIEAFQQAVDAMQRVLDSGPITEQEKVGPTPCSDFNVDQLADHILETHGLLLGAAGGEAPTTQGALSDRHLAVGSASVQQWTRRGTDGTIDLGGNELPATLALSLHTLETYIHAWDLAASLNRPFEPSDRLNEQMWDFARAFISDDMRGDFDGAPYGPAIELDDAASLTDRIIALSGRDPRSSTT